MKKYFYSLFAAATMLLAVTSCSQEEDLGKSSNGVTSFSISLNDKAGSRAAANESTLGKGTKIDKLYYEVFLGETSVYKDSIPNKTDPTSFESGYKLDLPLLNGETYSIVFWAQNSDCKIYGVNDADYLKEITVNYENVLANQESYDAFYHALVGFTANGNNNRVELTRPFAQLNLGTDDWSKVIVPSGTAPVTKTSVKVKGLADKFNPLTGDAIASQTEQELKYSAIPTFTKNNGTVDETVNEKFTVNGKEYTYLSLNYLLVPSQVNNEKATVDLTFNLQYGDEDNEKTLQPISVPNVPLQRNWRTNIIGSLLTGTDFDIVVKPETDGEENMEVTKVGSQAEIQEAIDNAEASTPTYLEVTGNITFGVDSKALSRAAETSYISIPAGKNVVLDLKGFTISGIEDATGSFSLIKNQGTLTITNSVETEGQLVFEAKNNRGWSAYSSVVSNTVGGNLTVESGVVIEHKGGTDMAYGIDNLTNGKGTYAETIINGGEIKSTYRPIRMFLNGVNADNILTVNAGIIESTRNNKAAIWMQDPSVNANTGTLTVGENAIIKNGVYLDVTKGSTEWPVTVSIAAAALRGEQKVITENLPVGYSVKEIDGVYTVVVTHVAKIGEVGYTTLQKAVDAVEDGGTIILVENIEQTEGVLITDKNVTIDLNNKTFKVSEGANTNNRNIKVNGSSVVTIKKGTMIAAGDYSSGAYGTLRTEDTANVTLESVKLYNYRGNGLNVKAYTGTVVTINNTEVYSQYGGGIEAAGGTIELNDVKVEQKGMYTAPYNSMAISVNGGGKVTVNSGTYKTECITAEEANNQGSSHGPWAAGVLNSGGTLIINGGTFVNDNFGDNTLATNARGLLLADTGANIQIKGGTFNALKSIIDIQNNLGDATKQPHVTLYGGNFSVNPLTKEGFITLAEGYKVVENPDVWNVVVDPVAIIGDTKYDTWEEAFAAAQSGSTITLLRDVTLAEELQLPAGIIFNGNGKQINGTIYAGGDLTFAGHTKVTSFSASYYNRTINIGEGACLEVTGTGRVTLGYGNTFNITGTIKNAKADDKANIQPSLIILGGISITGGNDAAFNVTNAYVKIGSTTSKPGVANGEFTLNFENSIVDFTKELGFYEPTGGMTPAFNMNIKNSVFTTGTKLFVTANSKVVVDNSTVTLGSYIRNSGEFELKNGSVLTGATIQFGENGGNNGTITVNNSELTVTTGNNKGHAFDGKGIGKIILENYATASVEYYKAMTIKCDNTSTFTGTEVQ